MEVEDEDDEDDANDDAADKILPAASSTKGATSAFVWRMPVIAACVFVTLKDLGIIYKINYISIK